MPNSDFQFNWPLVGNNHITDFLSRSLSSQQVSQGYIFAGPDNLGKTRAALYFAQSLLCENRRRGSGELPCRQCRSCRQFLGINHKKKIDHGAETNIIHGDFNMVKLPRDKKNISIEEIRGFIHNLGMSPLFDAYKVGVVKHAEALSEDAANALLKTLEEPQKDTVIILLVHRAENLPATIVSRCQVLDFRLVSADIIYDYLTDEHKTNRSIAKEYSHLALGRPALAVKFLENKEFQEKYTQRADIFLNFFSQDINERFKAIEGLWGADIKGQEAAKQAVRVLEIWEALVRDLILLNLGHRDMIHYQMNKKHLEQVRSGVNDRRLYGMVDLLSRARSYLSANVNPKFVLENVAMNI